MIYTKHPMPICPNCHRQAKIKTEDKTPQGKKTRQVEILGVGHHDQPMREVSKGVFWCGRCAEEKDIKDEYSS